MVVLLWIIILSVNMIFLCYVLRCEIYCSYSQFVATKNDAIKRCYELSQWVTIKIISCGGLTLDFDSICEDDLSMLCPLQQSLLCNFLQFFATKTTSLEHSIPLIKHIMMLCNFFIIFIVERCSRKYIQLTQF